MKTGDLQLASARRSERGAVERSIASAGRYAAKQTLVKMELMSVEITTEVSEDLQSYEKPEILELEAKDQKRSNRGRLKRWQIEGQRSSRIGAPINKKAIRESMQRHRTSYRRYLGCVQQSSVPQPEVKTLVIVFSSC